MTKPIDSSTPVIDTEPISNMHYRLTETPEERKDDTLKREARVISRIMLASILITISISVVGMFIHSDTDEAYSVATTSFTVPIDISTPDDTTEPLPSELDILSGKPAEYIAKTVWGEARGVSTTEQAAVIWCILNRVDSDLKYMPNDIISVITQDNAFKGYNANHPVTDDIYELTMDVLSRWIREKETGEPVGRVLPKEYLYFLGDGDRNHFTAEWRGTDIWDWSLESPYVEGGNL